MYKRQHWKHEDVSSSSDDDSSSEEDNAGSSESLSDGEGEDMSGTEASDALDQEANQSDAEQCSSSDVDADSITAEHVIQAWTSDDPTTQQFKGLPLRCVRCKVLMVNRMAYLNHISSKKHKHKLASAPPHAVNKPVIVLASEADHEEAETHTERLERIKQEVAAAAAGPRLIKPPAIAAPAKKVGAAGNKASTAPGTTATPRNGRSQQQPHARSAAKADDSNTSDSSDDEGSRVPQVRTKHPKGGQVVRAGAVEDRAGATAGALKANAAGIQQQPSAKGKREKGKRLGKRERAELKAAAEKAGVPLQKKPRRGKASEAAAAASQAAGSEAYMNSKARRAARRAAARQQHAG